MATNFDGGHGCLTCFLNKNLLLVLTKNDPNQVWLDKVTQLDVNKHH